MLGFEKLVLFARPGWADVRKSNHKALATPSSGDGKCEKRFMATTTLNLVLECVDFRNFRSQRR